jgi:uncharacterized protein YndB with AHSA1/START domain
MSRSVTVEASVIVPVSAERAFAELLDAEGQGRWMMGTSIYPVAGGVASPEVGSRLVAFTGALGFGLLDVMEVTEHVPGRRWVVAHHGNVIRGSGVFSVEPLPGPDPRSRVRWAEELDLPFGVLGRVGWPLVKPAVRWGLQKSLRSFAQLLSRG